MMDANILERMRSAFSIEALELLGELDTALLALETEPEQRTPFIAFFAPSTR